MLMNIHNDITYDIELTDIAMKFIDWREIFFFKHFNKKTKTTEIYL